MQDSLLDSITRIRIGRSIRRRKVKFQFDRSDNQEVADVSNSSSTVACCNGHHNGRLPSVAGNRVKIDPDGSVHVEKLSKKRPESGSLDLFSLPPIPYSLMLTTPSRDQHKKKAKRSPYLIREIDLNRLIPPRCLPRLCELEPQESLAEAEQCMENYFSARQTSRIESRSVIPKATPSVLENVWQDTKTKIARCLAPKKVLENETIQPEEADFVDRCFQTNDEQEFRVSSGPTWITRRIAPSVNYQPKDNGDVVTIDLDVLDAAVHCCA